MPDTVLSKLGIPIRFTQEAWDHILQGHSELAENRRLILNSIKNPDYVVDGDEGELLAVKQLDSGKWLVVVYRELAVDGFIITAYVTGRETSLKRKRQIWP